jgi:hypothetical protein
MCVRLSIQTKNSNLIWFEWIGLLLIFVLFELFMPFPCVVPAAGAKPSTLP